MVYLIPMIEYYIGIALHLICWIYIVVVCSNEMKLLFIFQMAPKLITLSHNDINKIIHDYKLVRSYCTQRQTYRT